MIIYIDTREKKPFKFPKPLKTKKKKLEVGDYSIKGGYCKNGIIIERKSLNDLFGTILNRMDNFLKELENMKKFLVKVVIVEASVKRIMQGVKYTMVDGDYILDRFIYFCSLNKVSLMFCDGRIEARLCAQKLLETFHNQGVKAKYENEFKPKSTAAKLRYKSQQRKYKKSY